MNGGKNMDAGKFPDFLIGGFQKCGTTSFNYNLPQHPDIEMALGPFAGEFNFFVSSEIKKQTYDRGVDWYKSNFKNDGKLWGESCPNFTIGSGHDRYHTLLKLIPNIKLIFSVRNPVDRLFSNYNHAVQDYHKTNNKNLTKWSDWNFSLPFDDNIMLNKSKGFLDKFPGLYDQVFYVLTELVGIPRNQILVVVQERMRDNPNVVFKQIFDFLEVKNFNITNNKIHVRHGNVDKIFKNLPQQKKMKKETREFLNDWYSESIHNLKWFMGDKILEWDT